MTHKTLKKQSLPNAPGRPAAPVAALERPSGLKKWASELVGIVKKQESTLFDGWDFGPGALTRHDFGRILKKISGCGSVVELRSAMDRGTGEIGSPVVHAANYCGQHTICPYCAGRVQDRRGARFRESIQAMAKQYPYAYLVTATIPPVPTWREDLDRLIGGWQAFRRKGQIRRRKRKDGTIAETRSGGEWGKVKAGLAKIELKRGSDSGLPHCHYHALVFTETPFDYRVWDPSEKAKPKRDRVPLYRLPVRLAQFKKKNLRLAGPERYIRRCLPGWVPASKISSEWFAASGGANFRLDPLRYREVDRKAGRSYEESIFDQSREVLKYATKFDSHPKMGAEKLFASDFVGIRDATYNRRLFVTYGDFRKVGGNDFEGGGPHISESPVIFESRWRGVEYSPLMHRSKPVFMNSDKTPAVTARLVILNRAQGQIRRMRSAIVKSKKHFRETGELRPAFFLRREFLEGGAFTDTPMALEIPVHVAAAPHDPETWERWLDVEMEKGRTYYAGVRESLALESIAAMDGTLEEKAAARESLRKSWLRSEAYAVQVTRLFVRTLCGQADEVNAASCGPLSNPPG